MDIVYELCIYMNIYTYMDSIYMNIFVVYVCKYMYII